jgi:hypothetical protein
MLDSLTTHENAHTKIKYNCILYAVVLLRADALRPGFAMNPGVSAVVFNFFARAVATVGVPTARTVLPERGR